MINGEFGAAKRLPLVHGVCGRGETGLRRARGSESSDPVQPLVIFRSPRRHDISVSVCSILSGFFTSRYPYSESCIGDPHTRSAVAHPGDQWRVHCVRLPYILRL
jgi:hypothetical protein